LSRSRAVKWNAINSPLGNGDQRAILAAREPSRMIREALDLVRQAEARGVQIRLIGGIAVALHSGVAASPHREFSDLDAVIVGKSRRSLPKVLAERGYVGDKRFNALNSDRRMIFYSPSGKLDVFVDEFSMCHRVPLAERLSLDSPTVSPTDLLLTKLQVVKFSTKDVADLVLLLKTHDLSQEEGDCINVNYLRLALGRDWGLWRTVTHSLLRLATGADDSVIAAKARALHDGLSAIVGDFRFRLRGVIGQRIRWYDLPEEVTDV